jgi:hypothetical protein
LGTDANGVETEMAEFQKEALWQTVVTILAADVV